MIHIVTDSTASIPHDEAAKNGIEVASMFVNYNGVEFEDASMDIDAFYADIYDMVDNIPTSSQPSQGVLENMFERIAKSGDDLLAIFMSSKMSGTVEGALRAARSVADRYEGFRFRIVDSSSNSFDEAWSVFAAVAARAEGSTLEQCCMKAVESIKASRFLFAPESLRFLKAGGRIGNAAALIGSLLKLCPVITVSDGESTTFAKVRTHKRALATIAEKFKDDCAQYGMKNAIVHYIGSPDEAIRWARETIEPIYGREVDVVPVSPVIGLHVGPAIGIAYECEQAISGKISDRYPAMVHAS